MIHLCDVCSCVSETKVNGLLGQDGKSPGVRQAGALSAAAVA